MEISNLNFTKYLSSDKKNFYYLEEFLKDNNSCLELVIEYDKISYIDDYSKFFFLFSRRETFLDQFQDYLNQYILHESSIFYILFFRFKFSDALKDFRYELKSVEDSIIYIDVFLQIEMFKIIERILFNYPFIASSLVGKSPIPDYDNPILINNPNLLLISVFIFEPIRLFNIITRDVSLYQSPASSDELKEVDLYFIKETIFNIGETIFEKTGRRYSKFFNPELFKYDLNRIQITENFWSFISVENLSQSYQVNSDFILCNEQLSFGLVEYNKYHLDFKNFISFEYFYDSFLDKRVGSMNQKKINQLRLDDIDKEQKSQLISVKLKSILRINIDLISANNIANTYINSKLLGDVNLKEDFKMLFHFLKTPEITQIPSLRNTSLETIKYLLSFFITLKNETKVFDFSSIEKLIYLLLYISNNIDAIDNTQLRKVHRLQKFKLHKDLIKELKSLVPINYLNNF